jgi:hypothetical protein
MEEHKVVKSQWDVVQLAADLAEALRDLLSTDEDLPSYQDTVDAAEAVLARAIKAGLIRDDV